MKLNPLFISPVFFLVLASFQLKASPQIPDLIIYKKDTIVTFNLILEQYFQRHEKTSPEKLFGLSFRDGSTFNCWRGYQAIYKIENDSLFLVDIIKPFELKSGKIDKIVSTQKMKEIFGDKLQNTKVYIDWFSGDLSFPLNNKVIRWDGVFYTIFEKESVINILGGKVLKIEDVVNYINEPNAINRLDKNKISDTLFHELKKVRWKKIIKCDCSDKYLVTIGENGRISQVKLNDQQTVPDEENQYCMNLIFTKLNKLKFDIIKNKGKPMAEEIYIEIWITDDGKIENWTR